MLSRVADSLYWMSRYFERADHCARVLESNFNLMLNPSRVSFEQRWQRISAGLGLGSDLHDADPQSAMLHLISAAKNRSSIVYSIAMARENASQISSEMWECLNQLYHEITQFNPNFNSDAEPLRLLNAIHEGSYKFHGVTDATMSHGEGWRFIQLGKYMERACALSVLLDAHFAASADMDDLDWVGLLSSCSAFEAYCKVYTADLKPDRVMEFLLLNADFPYTVRYSAEQMHCALEAIGHVASPKKAARIERITGRLRASLAYAQIDDIIPRDLPRYLTSVIEQCWSLHSAVHEVYTDYPIESAFEA